MMSMFWTAVLADRLLRLAVAQPPLAYLFLAYLVLHLVVTWFRPRGPRTPRPTRTTRRRMRKVPPGLGRSVSVG